jgi:ADP-heptose:LPS heptosyltransferase
MPVTVIGRADCLFALEGTGAEGVPFANPSFSRLSPRTLMASLRNALALRKAVPGGGTVLDLEADPRSALLLRLAGFHRVIAYERDHARFFHALLPLQAGIRHQADKGIAVAEAFLRREGMDPAAPAARAESPEPPIPKDAPLLLSCFTRKDTKNWPYASWDALLSHLLAQGRPLRVLVPPDGDAGFRDFQARWKDRIEFLEGGLPAVDAAVRASAGIIATDNFLGHLAADRGKPVLWINGSSDPGMVAPRGRRTRVVQKEPMPCRPCSHRCVNPVHRQCLLELAPEQVIGAAGPWLTAL